MKTLLELGDGDCRWPEGRPEWNHDGLQRFCARPKLLGKPYCKACCDVAYLRAQATDDDELARWVARTSKPKEPSPMSPREALRAA